MLKYIIFDQCCTCVWSIQKLGFGSFGGTAYGLRKVSFILKYWLWVLMPQSNSTTVHSNRLMETVKKLLILSSLGIQYCKRAPKSFYNHIRQLLWNLSVNLCLKLVSIQRQSMCGFNKTWIPNVTKLNWICSVWIYFAEC